MGCVDTVVNTLQVISWEKVENHSHKKLTIILPDIFAYSHARDHLFHCFFFAIFFVAV